MGVELDRRAPARLSHSRYALRSFARISNFLLWEVAYTELWFTDLYWPDWDVDALKRACTDYGTRERRKGGR